MYIKYSDFLNNLNESFSDIDSTDILTDEFIKDFIESDECGGLLDYYIEDNNLDFNDKDEIQNSDDFFNFIKSDLTSYYENFMDNIYDIISNNTLKIYRSITVDDDWLDNFIIDNRNIGIYWSFDENAAEPHWGEYGKNEVIFEALINENEIDWKTTIELNVNPTYSDEKEIRLFENTELNIISIKFNDEYIDMSKFKNKKYFA
jgi:hypothetical protein